MSKDLRFTVVLSVLGAGAVTLFVPPAAATYGALPVLTFLGVLVLVAISVAHD